VIITGTGRCGTGYVAKLLTSAGIQCGHEDIFSFDGWTGARERLAKTDLDADSSWLAAPFLDRLNGATIVHLVRHPKPTIDSFRRIGFFNPRWHRAHHYYARFARQHLPEAWDYRMTKMRAAHFYVGWNRMIEELAPDAVFHRIEDGGPALLDKLGIEHDGDLFNDASYNHRDGMVVSDVDLTALWEPCRSMIAEMAERYGYEIRGSQ
jgi:hypothetical protein